MWFGPCKAPVRVGTPLNLEGWLGVAVAALLALQSCPAARPLRFSRAPRWIVAALQSCPAARPLRFSRAPRWIVAALLVLSLAAVAAFWRALHCAFLADDFVLVNYAAHATSRVLSLFATAGGDGFFRPVGYLSLALTSPFAGVHALRWHAVALALHVLNAVLVFALFLRLGVRTPAALLGALVFAVHGTRPEAVVWIAGRFDLMATFFVLAALLLFLHAEPPSPVARASSLLCMVLAILCKESAYIFPLFLLLPVGPGRPRRRASVLLPFFAAAAALFAYRCWLFAGIGGYRDAATGAIQALTFGLPTIKALGLRIWTALFFPVNWSAEPGRWMAAATVAYLAALICLAASRPSRSLLAFAIGFLFIAALPPLHLLGIGPDLGNSRLLYLPSVGFCLMLAAAVDGLRNPARWIVPCLILAFHLAVFEHNLDQWQAVSDQVRAVAETALACPARAPERLTAFGVPATLRGVPFLANTRFQDLEFVAAAEKFTPPTRPRTAPEAVPVWEQATGRLRCVERQ
jgi:hypothetical protein